MQICNTVVRRPVVVTVGALTTVGSALRPFWSTRGLMIKSELISRIAKQNPRLFANDVEKAVNTILDEIATALVRSDRVELRGFGTFTVRTWGPRPLGRNPKTGAPINIPETHHPSFRTGKEMHHRLNGTLDAPRSAFHKPGDATNPAEPKM
jgi:integration host factor subunit beta